MEPILQRGNGDSRRVERSRPGPDASTVVLAVALLIVLAACSSSPTPEPTPESTPEPDPTATPGKYTDVEQTLILAESIDLVHCGTEPMPDWCPWFVRVDVTDHWAEVYTDLTEAEVAVAESMCHDIASVTWDDDAEPIGVTDVVIYAADGENALTDCDVVPTGEEVATPAATVSPSVLPTLKPQALDAGSYSVSRFPVGITFEIPAFEPPTAWFECSASTVEQAVCYFSDEHNPPAAAAVTFQIVVNVVADPCSDQQRAELLDPPVGPSVDDLVTAISNLEGYEATAPVDITVSGFQGMEFTLTAPDTEGCGATWTTAVRTTGVGPGEINLLRILDVDGVRVVISGAYHPELPDAATDAAVVEQVMDSVEIEP